MGDAGSRRRWLAPAFFVSMALNLLVVGVFVGAVLRDGPPHRGGGDKGRGDPTFPYIRALDEPQREALRDAFRTAMRDARTRGDAERPQDHARVAEGYEAAAEAPRAEPFDPEALERAMSRQAESAAARRARGQAVLVDFLAGLTPEARADYADRLDAEIARFGDR